MADTISLGDVSSKDTGTGSKLKTGGRRKHNMPKGCVRKKVKEGMTVSQAVKFCYPDNKKIDSKKLKSAMKSRKITNPRTKMQTTSKDTTKSGY